MSVPKDILNNLNGICVQKTAKHADGATNIALHPVYIDTTDQQRKTLTVQSPLLSCYGVCTTRDGSVHLLAEAGRGDWRKMLSAVDDTIVASIAEFYGFSSPDVARLRFLSSTRTVNGRDRLKMRLPMRDDVPDVQVYDNAFNPVASTMLLNDSLKEARVAVIVQLDAAWVLGNGGWFGAHWIVKQLLLKQHVRDNDVPIPWQLDPCEDEKKDPASERDDA